MVKGNSAAANADAMVYDAMAAFYMACASFMSQNYGAGKLDRVKKSYFIALAYSFGLGAVLGGGLLVFGRQFLALFTTESAVIDAGMKRIMVMGWAYCTSAFMDCTIAASRGLGKTVGPTIIVILGSCVFRVAWVYTIFAHFHTIPAALPAVSLLLGADRRRRDRLFCVQLPPRHPPSAGARCAGAAVRAGERAAVICCISKKIAKTVCHVYFIYQTYRKYFLHTPLPRV
mgnify:CR=1 FL=1